MRSFRYYLSMAGVYIHIPFCKKACNYCDFHFSTHLASKPALVKALLYEIDIRKDYLISKRLKSIYFGGGTPSLLSQDELMQIISRLANYFTWDKSTEITLEANPDDITTEHLKMWKTSGINRLSIGLQSFNDEELKWMKRVHTAKESENSVKMAQDSGFNNISIDLIYGSKFQNVKSWDTTLNKAVRLNTQHVSAYNLTIEDKTELGLKLQRGKEPGVDEYLSELQFKLLRECLKENGFIQYEVSNFGRENYFAQHNSSYWKQEPYLGIGPSAHSYNHYSRQWNVRNNALYIKGLELGQTYFETETLSTKNMFNEYVLTRLRTIWGCDTGEIAEKFGIVYAKHFKKKIEDYSKFFLIENNVYRLNEEGLLKADGLASDFFLL